MSRASLALFSAFVFTLTTMGFSETVSKDASTVPKTIPNADPIVKDSLVKTDSESKVEGAGPIAPEKKAGPVREKPDLRLFNDPPLIAKEYGLGILGSLVAGALGFYIGSGVETAIRGESEAHKGTLSFTGIRYDNFQGAFYGGTTGIALGSALTTYFVGQTDEEDGGLLLTLAGTLAAAGGALYAAHLMGVNDEIDWKPFLPLLVIPSLGGTLGFNVSRWNHDRERERVVGQATASVWLHAPRIAWGRDAGGDRLEFQALHLTF